MNHIKCSTCGAPAGWEQDHELAVKLEDENKMLREEVASYRARLDLAENYHDQAEAEVERLREMIEPLEERVNDLIDSRREMAEELDRHGKQIERLSKRKLARELVELRARVAELEAERDSMQKVLNGWAAIVGVHGAGCAE